VSETLVAEAASSAWLVIDFERNTPDPARVFRAATAMIDALADADRMVVAGLGYQVVAEPVLLDIEVGSLRTRLGNVIRNVPDDVLAAGDLKEARKKLVGHALVRGKAALLRWCDKAADAPRADLRVTLQRAQREIDAEVRASGAAQLGYSPPPLDKLAEVMRKVDGAKAQLSRGDAMRYEAAGLDPVGLEPEKRLDEQAIEDALTDRVITNQARMILTVRRPDFLSVAQWDFKHGSEALSARIADQAWLGAFRERRVPLAPGDALDADVEVTARYAPGGGLLRKAHVIQVVHGVVPQDRGGGML